MAIIVNPCIPFVGQIDKFTPQESVRIQGTISQLSYRFNINLQCGPNDSPRQDDIALQISVRYFNRCIFLNSFRYGTWDNEVCISPMPIKCDEKFEIVILCELNQYKVIINGSSQYDFPQRISYDKISHLRIDGDVSITQISYESFSKDPVVLDIVHCPETTKVQKLKFQPPPVVKPARKTTPCRCLWMIIAIILIIAGIVKLIRLINIAKNNDSQNYNLGYKVDFKDDTNN